MTGIRNLNYLRNKDPKLFETLSDIIQQHSNLTEQVNGNSTGQPLAPPNVAGVTVTAQNGHFNVAIQDQGKIYRDVHYYVEHADNPSFANPQIIHLGHSRNHDIYLGNVTRYFRAYSAYASSAAGDPAYHGSPIAPLPVVGGGADPGPLFQQSEGSGTGTRGQGLSGPGPVPFRSTTGVPPTRGENTGPTGGSGSSNFVSLASAGVPSGIPSLGGGGSSSLNPISVTQAGLAALAATLGTNNVGQPAYVTDYDHTLYWTGTGWTFRNGDRSAFIQGFLVDPTPTTGWHLCDGSSVSYLNSDGTLTAGYVLPDMVSTSAQAAYFKMGSPATASTVAAVAPTLAMNSYTPVGTISTPTFSGTPFTPSGTISTPTFSGNPLTPSGSVTINNTTLLTALVFAGTITAVTQAIHNHTASFTGNSVTPTGTISTPTFSGNSVTPAGTISTPIFSGTPATLTGTISATGEPQNLILRPWFRV